MKTLSSKTGGAAIGPDERSRTREEDLLLARKAAAGDRTALDAVVEHYAKALFQLALGLCWSMADAEDVVQETFVAVFRKIGGFAGRASLLTWMSRILVRRARKMARKARRNRAMTLDEAFDQHNGEAKSFAARSPSVDCRLDLAVALPLLSPDYREVIVLRELQGMSYADIARTLGIPRGTVESRLHRARLALRNHLRAYEQ